MNENTTLSVEVDNTAAAVESQPVAEVIMGENGLAAVIGIVAAKEWFDERAARREFLAERAVKRFPGSPYPSQRSIRGY